LKACITLWNIITKKTQVGLGIILTIMLLKL